MPQAPRALTFDALFVAKETVSTFMMTAFGENLPITIKSSVARKPITDYEHGAHVTLIRVDMVVEVVAYGRTHVVEMAVPIIQDGRYYRAANRFFSAKTADESAFLVWSNAGHFDLYNTITARTIPTAGSGKPMVLWYVGCGFESLVLFRCQYRDLPGWVTEIIMSDQEAKKLACY